MDNAVIERVAVFMLERCVVIAIGCTMVPTSTVTSTFQLQQFPAHRCHRFLSTLSPSRCCSLCTLQYTLHYESRIVSTIQRRRSMPQCRSLYRRQWSWEWIFSYGGSSVLFAVGSSSSGLVRTLPFATLFNITVAIQRMWPFSPLKYHCSMEERG